VFYNFNILRLGVKVVCGLLKFEDLLEFGTLANGVLRIDKTFEFEQKSGGQSLCLIVNA
jgi:hypothetical protein